MYNVATLVNNTIQKKDTSRSPLNKATGCLIQESRCGKHEPLSFLLHPATSGSTYMKPRSARAIFWPKEGRPFLWVVQWKDSRHLDPDSMPRRAAAAATDGQPLDFLMHEKHKPKVVGQRYHCWHLRIRSLLPSSSLKHNTSPSSAVLLEFVNLKNKSQLLKKNKYKYK